MVEFIGLLKVTIKKGTNMAIRDMMSSDPYVVLTLGQQVIIVNTFEILKGFLFICSYHCLSDHYCHLFF